MARLEKFWRSNLQGKQLLSLTTPTFLCNDDLSAFGSSMAFRSDRSAILASEAMGVVYDVTSQLPFSSFV